MKTNVSKRYSEFFNERTGGGTSVTTERRAAAEKVPKFTANPFALGVSSGEPLPDGVVLWTRLAPEPLGPQGGMPPEDVTVKWEVARDSGFREIVKQGEKAAKREYAHSVHVEVEGLEPDSIYYYRFHAGYETSQTGRTKTLPLPSAKMDHLAFAFVSCQHFEEGYYTAYRRLAEESLDFVLHLGDAIYEYGPGTAAKNVRLHKGAETLTLEDYRTRHAQYLYDADYQRARALFPWIVTWDDHDVENNYAGLIPEKNQSPDRFILRRASAYQAYFEHMPLRQSSIPRGAEMSMYRRVTYGDLAEFHILDTRQYRDDQANNDGNKPPSFDSTDPSRTILGQEQKRWLYDGLRRSQSIWNVLAQQVFFSQVDHQAGEVKILPMDGWDGYSAERNEVVEFLQKQHISNPIVLTGDVHTNWVFDIKSDFDNPNSTTVGAEFAGTSISSGGDRASSLHPDTLYIENPHLKFFNDQRGYVRCTVTPQYWRSDYRLLDYVSRPGAPITTAVSFICENGRPGVRRVSENV
ncbi:alkaline phosphatase D family protein [Bacillus swezeyi]|uniref:Alkaline phosphatase n=1 Tax=Bacillus swezeyi TaxID=1925020 RepID=A0A5M8RYJ2_9BACI|nr:alkaline phosphatase D family protein [Bacillus swezeyi]KAA6451894.1 alkaline phosphatase [Bacillus swezeyi]KAA6473585.1 alkaline phosphatase [Bacillus swezeyi]TYS36116.1 alkaline phosphatase [Bacillus swezeyi]